MCRSPVGSPATVVKLPRDVSYQPMRFRCRLLRQAAHAHQQMIPPMTANTIASGIQMGASTHHHDQEMIPPSFSPMNRIASRPKNPMPPFEVLLLPILICMASVYPAGGRLPGSASRRPRRADGPRVPLRAGRIWADRRAARRARGLVWSLLFCQGGTGRRRPKRPPPLPVPPPPFKGVGSDRNYFPENQLLSQKNVTPSDALHNTIRRFL